MFSKKANGAHSPVFHKPTLYPCFKNGNTALSIAKRLGYISVVDTLRVVTEEVVTTTTVSSMSGDDVCLTVDFGPYHLFDTSLFC